MSILAIASWKLAVALLDARATGAVLLGETTRFPNYRGMKYPYPLGDAWAYLLGWFIVACGGASLACASSRRFGRVILAMAALFAGLILTSAATLISSAAGLATFIAVVPGGIGITIITMLSLEGRGHRELEETPERKYTPSK